MNFLKHKKISLWQLTKMLIVIILLASVIWLLIDSSDALNLKYPNKGSFELSILEKVLSILFSVLVGYVGVLIKLWLDEQQERRKTKIKTLNYLDLIGVEVEYNENVFKAVQGKTLTTENVAHFRRAYDDKIQKDAFLNAEIDLKLIKDIHRTISTINVFLSNDDVEKISANLSNMVSKLEELRKEINAEKTRLETSS